MQHNHDVPAIDRTLARLGASRLCRLRPGMGWMLFELSPVSFWISCTGAMILGPGSFYFNEFLKYSGASQQYLATVPLLYAFALLLATVWNMRLSGSKNPRRACLTSCWWGRCLWLLIPCIPWIFEPGPWRLAAIGLIILAAQTILVAGMSSWAAWTQRLVPNRHRPAFFAYRHLLAAALTLPSIALLRAVWSDGEAYFGPLAWLQIVFCMAGGIAVLGTLPLQWAPRMPTRSDQRQNTTALNLPVALRQAGGLKPYMWTFWATAGIALTTVYLPEVLKNSGLSTADNLLLDIWLRTPAMIIATLSGPFLARKMGQLPLIIANSVLHCRFNIRRPILAE